nr:Na+/H+ antiporter NhaA [Hyphomonas sp.]
MTAWPRGEPQPDVSDCVDKAPFIPDPKAATADAGHLPADSSASTRHAALAVFAAMSIAFIWVNSPAVGTYDFIHHTPFSIQLGEVGLSKPLVDWINEGLMVFFFFAIGLEIKREVLVGDLASPRRIALPAIGALGGMLAPAAIYLMFNAGNPDTEHGWAVPVATDIVLALAVLSVLGARVPASLKVFLMALAVFDDFGTLAVIALFYTEGVSLVSLTMAGFGLAVLIGLNRMRISNMTPYVLIGIFVWVAVLESGVHATIAGVLVAWTIPLTINGRPVLTVIEAGMKPWVAYGVVPIFAFFNSGIHLAGITPSSLLGPASLGAGLGLFLGKPLGVFGAAGLAVWSGLGRLPLGVSWLHLLGASFLAGVGFTISLFVAALAFDSPTALQAVTLSVIIGSTLSAVTGLGLLAAARQRLQPLRPDETFAP